MLLSHFSIAKYAEVYTLIHSISLNSFGQGSEDLVLIHDELDFGHCHLSIAVSTLTYSVLSHWYVHPFFCNITLYWLLHQIPQYGIFENVNSIEELAQMPHWTEERPLRIATGFSYVRQHSFFLSFLVFHFNFQIETAYVQLCLLYAFLTAWP